MNKIPPHLRSKVRVDAIDALRGKNFVTQFDAFIMGVEYALNQRPHENIDETPSPPKSESVKCWISRIANKAIIGKNR